MDCDLFHEPLLDFQLRKPPAWRFLPPQWSPLAQLKRLDDPSVAWAKNANTPFCCAMGPLFASSAVQVCARPPIAHNPALASTLLEAQLSMLRSKYRDFEPIAASSRARVAGCESIHIRGTFSVLNGRAGDTVRLSVLSRTYTVFSPQAMFSVGLSGSADPEHFLESDFELILASIRIGPAAP